VKERKPERYHIGSDEDVRNRERLLLMEAREEIHNMEREAQHLILEQQQAFKHQQHLTELQAYLAMERQQQDTERQLNAHIHEAQQEEATMMRKLREVEFTAVKREENEEQKCSKEYDELRSYVERLRIAAETEVHKENQAEAQEARVEILSVENGQRRSTKNLLPTTTPPRVRCVQRNPRSHSSKCSSNPD
jgi:hypothetical protein